MMNLHPNKTPIRKDLTGAAIKRNFIMPQTTLFCNRFLKSNSGYPPRKDLDGGGPINLIILVKNNLSHILTTMRLHKAGDINRQSSRETPVRHGRQKRKIKPKGEKEKKLSPDGQGPKKGRTTHPIKQAKTYRNRSLNRPKCLRTKTTIGKPLSQRRR